MTKGTVANMVITDVRIRKLHSEGRMKAIVSITFDDAFAVHDIKVVEGDKGLFVAMPSKRMPDGEYKDIAHPISSGVREMVQSAVLKEYEAALAAAEAEAEAEADYEAAPEEE
jgi:stage V sporulation protein G